MIRIETKWSWALGCLQVNTAAHQGALHVITRSDETRAAHVEPALQVLWGVGTLAIAALALTQVRGWDSTWQLAVIF